MLKLLCGMCTKHQTLLYVDIEQYVKIKFHSILLWFLGFCNVYIGTKRKCPISGKETEREMVLVKF